MYACKPFTNRAISSAPKRCLKEGSSFKFIKHFYLSLNLMSTIIMTIDIKYRVYDNCKNFKSIIPFILTKHLIGSYYYYLNVRNMKIEAIALQVSYLITFSY